jgi:ribosomal protein S18 acetylase RimI-like enzyme
MENILDNPVWNALISGNRHLAAGSDRVKFFDPDVSPFAAGIENSLEELQELYDIYPADRPVFLWAPGKLVFPEVWKLMHCIAGLQMSFDQPTAAAYKQESIVALTKENIPEMLALTKLTKPGPFGTRTIEFGNYEGIFENGQLVAMTGQRFHCFDHIEVSAVCTHPDHLGKGYAKQLLLSRLTKILAASCRPYLHVREDNERAIHVYKALGFSVRMPVNFYVIKK